MAKLLPVNRLPLLLSLALDVCKQLPTYAAKGETPPRQALKAKREAYWEEYGGFRDTPIYEQKFLQSGNVIQGPAIIEAEQTATVLPPGTRLFVDKYLNLLIERV